MRLPSAPHRQAAAAARQAQQGRVRSWQRRRHTAHMRACTCRGLHAAPHLAAIHAGLQQRAAGWAHGHDLQYSMGKDVSSCKRMLMPRTPAPRRADARLTSSSGCTGALVLSAHCARQQHGEQQHQLLQQQLVGLLAAAGLQQHTCTLGGCSAAAPAATASSSSSCCNARVGQRTACKLESAGSSLYGQCSSGLRACQTCGISCFAARTLVVLHGVHG